MLDEDALGEERPHGLDGAHRGVGFDLCMRVLHDIGSRLESREPDKAREAL